MSQFLSANSTAMDTVLRNYHLMDIILSYVDDVKDRVSFEMACKYFRDLSLYSLLPSLKDGFYKNLTFLKIVISYNTNTIDISVGTAPEYKFTANRDIIDNELLCNNESTSIALIGFLRRFLLQTRNVHIEVIDDNGERNLEEIMWLDKCIIQLILEMRCKINEITLTPIIYPCRNKEIYKTLKYIYKNLQKLNVNINIILDILWKRDDEDINVLEYDLFYNIFKGSNISSIVISPKDTSIQCSFREWMKLYFDIKFINFESIIKAVFLIDCRCVCCSQTSGKIYQSFLRNSPLFELSLNFSPFNVLNPGDIFYYIPENISDLHISIYMDNFDVYECLRILKEKHIRSLEINNVDCFQFVDIPYFLESFPLLRGLSLSEVGATFITQLAEYLSTSNSKNNIEFLEVFSKFETKAFIALKSLKQKFQFSRMDPSSFECITLGFNYANNAMLIKEYSN
uniref:F-box domain-containing protein n=1 Tax=Strongyloides venezuelensis TaxID=75913 RepID=A0A0K0G015_STRVS